MSDDLKINPALFMEEYEKLVNAPSISVTWSSRGLTISWSAEWQGRIGRGNASSHEEALKAADEWIASERERR